MRAGIDDGGIEPYDFTDIDRTRSGGRLAQRRAWGRNGDTIGIAAVVNGISKTHQRYLAAGGIGVLVGDGRLPHPGPRQSAKSITTGNRSRRSMSPSTIKSSATRGTIVIVARPMFLQLDCTASFEGRSDSTGSRAIGSRSWRD